MIDISSSQKYPLSELVHVDEFTVGGKEKGCYSSRIKPEALNKKSLRKIY